ncbi:hypothetical protein G7092_02110 [Mucilaginibacter sp. HC2]|uniref:hypothetical protein n=1 Tax=Mucilaginibacter inviolabilis TaxID=2714892 RepID=UPI0014077559|nr:hypothetical protein [Mucilaginibacter inviolabilis]NHA02569.1 hypothetical protein [Mucilaginibacter inviolabilis]
MKTLQLTFEHPVKGNLRFRALSGQTDRLLTLRPFDTGQGHLLKIETDELENGRWELILEWEHEDRNFQHTQVFEVEGETGLFQTSLYADACLYHSRHPLHCMNH